MSERGNPKEVGARLAALLEELRTTSSPRVWERVEELLRITLDLYGRGLARVVELASGSASASEVRDGLLQDPLVATLLVLHGLHPVDARRRVAGALERVNRAAGLEGCVELVALDDDGLIRLRIDPARRARRAALQALRTAAVAAVLEAAPEAVRAEVEGLPPEVEAGGLVQLGRPPHLEPTDEPPLREAAP